MRRIVVIVLALALCACSVLDQINFGPATLDPNKIYLDAATTLDVAPRDTHRYACVGQPMLCLQRGAEFECRCP